MHFRQSAMDTQEPNELCCGGATLSRAAARPHVSRAARVSTSSSPVTDLGTIHWHLCFA